MGNLPYRECVVAVIRNEGGEFLVGERSDYPGQWQFPQFFKTIHVMKTQSDWVAGFC